MELNDAGKAEPTDDICIGCGICASICPENIISLYEKKRIVRLAPPRPS